MERERILEKVTVTDIGAGQMAVARSGSLVIFLPAAVPGDEADILITKRRKNYLEGVPVRFHKLSPDREVPRCKHFGVCGGCAWQNMKYEIQLFFKEKTVKNAFERIGHCEIKEFRPILSSEKQYYFRNKLEYTFSSRRWLTDEEIKSGEPLNKTQALGFHKPERFDRVIDITECHLQPEPTNLIRNAVRNYAVSKALSFYDIREHRGLLRNLIIRSTLANEVMVIVVFGEDDAEKIHDLLGFIREQFPQIASLMFVINKKKNDAITDQEVFLHSGKDYITEEMKGLKFRIGPKSFYQTNTRQALRLYEVVREMAGLTGSENVYDLYSGTGTIACFLASEADKVTGVEYVKEAVADAQLNASLNGINNVSFIEGDIKDLMTEHLFKKNGIPDVIVTDPPRSGMHKDVVKAIIEARPRKIVYVSCNPSTQARDIQMIANHYSVEYVQPVDMFPHTGHVENIALLIRK